MSKLSPKEITNKIIIKSKNRFVLKALCDELLRYEFKHDPLILSDNESTVKIDLDNKTLSSADSNEPAHFETPKDYLTLVKKIETVYKASLK